MENDLCAHRPPLRAGTHARPVVGDNETDICECIRKHVITKVNIYTTRATIMASNDVSQWTANELELLP